MKECLGWAMTLRRSDVGSGQMNVFCWVVKACNIQNLGGDRDPLPLRPSHGLVI